MTFLSDKIGRTEMRSTQRQSGGVYLKRVIVCLIVLLFLFSITACGNTAQSTEPAGSEVSSEGAAETSENAQEQGAAAAETPDDQSSLEEMEGSAEETEPALDLPPNEVLPEVSIADSAIDYPIYDDMETFSVICTANSIVLSTIPVDEAFNVSAPMEFVEEDTHVHLDFMVWNDSSCVENVQLAIASGSYPDLWGFSIAEKTNSSIDKLIDDEVVMDVVDLIEDNAPEIYALMEADNSFAKKLYSSDGAIGSIIGRQIDLVGSDGGMYIRMDMLEKMGIEIDPKEHMSIEQLTDIMRAAKSTFNCKLPLLIFRSMECGLGNAFNVVDDGLNSSTFSYQLKEPGKTDIQCSLTSENFRDYIELLRGYYEEGLMTDDYTGVAWALGTADQWCLSNDTCIFPNSTNLSAMVSVMELSDPDYNAVAIADPYAYEGMTCEVDSTGSGGFAGGGVSLSTQCHDPEGMLQYLNYFFCEEGRMYSNYGVEGVSWEYNDDGEIVYTDNYLNNPKYSIATREQMFKVSWGAPTNGYYRAIELRYTDEQMETIKTWAIDRGNDLTIPGYYFTTDEVTELSATATDISTYLYEEMYKAVVGEITMEDWDDSVDTAYDMGLDRCEELYKIATDRYIERIGW